MAMQVAVLGATGSIGTSTLDVIERHPGRLRASVLAAGSNVDALLALCIRFRPAHAAIADEAGYPALRDGLREAGLDDREVVDLATATAFFAWANRLMLSLGEAACPGSPAA